ncbi:MAG: hypothetical protein KIT56_01265 [Gammaproteobacteria bacterium]|nr:hypothetical protein [Gammaproteobacteria bacterium]MCW5582514.1 hypothetical protein [Gammaproteobacteria bacterium]
MRLRSNANAACNRNKKLAEWVLEQTKNLVPYAANKLPDNSDSSFLHRQLLLNAVRANKSQDRTGICEIIRNWNMPIEAQVPNDFANGLVKLKLHDPETLEVKEEILSLKEAWNRVNMIPLTMGQKKLHKDKTDMSVLDILESVAKNAVKHKIGNCDENAAVAFSLLLEETYPGIKVPIERISIPGNHAFIVIGRDQNGKLRDMSAWGPEAIIIDPWMNEVVVVKEYFPISNKSKKSPCFFHIHNNEKKLFRILLANVGDGHTQRWNDHRNNKREFLLLREWKPINKTENDIPWVKEVKVDDKEEGERPNKKQRRY